MEMIIYWSEELGTISETVHTVQYVLYMYSALLSYSSALELYLIFIECNSSIDFDGYGIFIDTFLQCSVQR